MKRLLIIVLSIFMIFLCGTVASAAPVEEDIVNLSSSKSIVFWVEWDTEKPYVVFIAPDGTEMNPDAESPDTVTVFGDNSLFYTVYNAPAGQWRIKYEKGNNKEIEVSVSDYTPGIFVEKLTLGSIDGDRMDVAFLITGEEDRTVDYRISAVVDGSEGEKLLYSGSCRLGEEKSVTVDLSSLSSYSKYKLKLYAYYSEDGTDIFDFVYSEEFSYTNSRSEEIKFDYNVTVFPCDNLIRVNWSDIGVSNVEKVLIGIFYGNESEPSIFDIYDPSFEEKEFAYDPTAGNYTVEVTLTVDGINSVPNRKSFDLSSQEIILPDSDAVNTLSLPVKYFGFNDCFTKITVNDTYNELILNADGSFTVELQDDWNDFQLEFTDDDGINWNYSKKLLVDRIAPVLSMNRNYDGISTEENKIIISGIALDLNSLIVNGEAVIPAADGSFSKELTLAKGENVVTVIAADAAGNSTIYTASINCGGSVAAVNGISAGEEKINFLDKLFSDDSYIVLIAVSIFCVLIVVYAAVFWRKKKEKSNEKK